jgi:uncharacterized lipoprotein YddW (UPF0748 family)
MAQASKPSASKPQRYSVVVDGDVMREGLGNAHAQAIAHEVKRQKPNVKVSVVPHDPSDPLKLRSD